MTVEELFRFVNFVSNKNESGAIGPDEFNNVLQVVNIDYFKELYGLPEEYQPGRPLPRKAWQMTQKITDDLGRFLKSENLVVTNGYADLPADYVHASSMMYNFVKTSKCGTTTKKCSVPVEFVNDDEYNKRLCHSIAKPSYRYPIYTREEDRLKFAPEDIDSVHLNYLRLPEKPERAYTVVNDESVYDPGNSTQLDWPETTHNDIAIRVLAYFGIHLREGELAQAVKQRQIQGQ